MGYRTLQHCLRDLERTGQLVRVEVEVDPHLEAAEIHRRVFAAGGPAVYFARVKGCRFPMVSNLFGTLERARFLFRDTLDAVRQLVELKADPAELWKQPWRYGGVVRAAWHMRPRLVRRGPILAHRTTVDQLPQLQCWPDDGGAFITLPEVYTESPERPGWRHSNLGMYRVQMSGGKYLPNRQVGLHYQIHRSIGVHHAEAIRRREGLRVNVFVGGAPAMMLAAVMPLPEGLPELMFAGALGGHRIPLIRVHADIEQHDGTWRNSPSGVRVFPPECASADDRAGGPPAEAAISQTLSPPESAFRIPHPPLPLYAQADFCLTGWVDPHATLPEGPFGDHLGYYSLVHDFPVLNVERVYHRPGAVWPFTVVGRPPQEDTTFGALIHELTGPAIPAVVPGVHAVHAVDAAGVHPLLLAIGSERYVPYARQRRPQELLTCAHAILGQGQLSLAKYLLIVAREDDPDLDIHDIPRFFTHWLKRVDWRTDLHFQTCTTIDTLDYSGSGLNAGSKLVIAAAGPPRRELPADLPSDCSLPGGFREPRVCLPGVLALEAPPYAPRGADGADDALENLCRRLDVSHPINRFPLIVAVDDSDFTARRLNNFLWVAFTRSNPAADVHGIEAFIHQKHWGCRGSLVIDARVKPHHAPPLVEDPAVSRRVDRLAAPGGPLHGII